MNSNVSMSKSILAQREGDSKHVISRLQFIRIQFWECKKFKRPFFTKSADYEEEDKDWCNVTYSETTLLAMMQRNIIMQTRYAALSLQKSNISLLTLQTILNNSKYTWWQDTISVEEVWETPASRWQWRGWCWRLQTQWHCWH